MPIVEGARTTWPNTAAVEPARSTSQSSMTSAPASTAWITVMALCPTFARPGRVAQVDPLVEQLPQTQMLSHARRGDQPGVGHQPLVIEGHLDTVQTVPR